MGHVNLSMLIDYYLGDMRSRNCTEDAITTNRRSLQRFERFLSADGQAVNLSDVTPEGSSVKSVRKW